MKNIQTLLGACFLGAFLTFAPILGWSSYAVAGSSQTGGAPGSLTKVFTASGSDVVPSWATSAMFTLQGAGGGSNGVNGGGGGGQTYEQVIVPVTGGTTLTITVGVGGTAGIAGADGTAGGNTTVTGASLSLPIACGGAASVGSSGGLGGGNCTGGNAVTISALGVPTGATMSQFTPGQVGGSANTNQTCIFDWTLRLAVSAGHGACSKYGKGGAGVGSASNGNPGTGFGSGAGAGSGSLNGAAGASGFVLITYYP